MSKDRRDATIGDVVSLQPAYSGKRRSTGSRLVVNATPEYIEVIDLNSLRKTTLRRQNMKSSVAVARVTLEQVERWLDETTQRGAADILGAPVPREGLTPAQRAAFDMIARTLFELGYAHAWRRHTPTPPTVPAADTLERSALLAELRGIREAFDRIEERLSR